MKLLFVKRLENESNGLHVESNLKVIAEFKNQSEANAIIDSFTERAKFDNSFIGTYYLIPAQEIKIVRE